MPEYRSASGSAAEDLFIDLFADTFGAEKNTRIRAYRNILSSCHCCHINPSPAGIETHMVLRFAI